MRYKLYKGNGILAGYADIIEEVQERCDQQKGWYYKLPKDVSRTELSKHIDWLCVNKELEPFGVTYSDVKKGKSREFHHQVILEKRKFLGIFPYIKKSYRKIIWHQYYTFKTKEEYENWKSFCIDTLTKFLEITREQAELKFINLDFLLGLKKEYL